MFEFFIGSDQALVRKNVLLFTSKYIIIGIAILSLIFLSHSISAQSSGIFGTVKTETGENMPYTNVVIVGKSIGTATNYDGEYILSLEPGKYRISYQFIGYKSEVKDIEVLPNSISEINIQLAEEKVFLNAVEVTATSENPAYEIIRNAQAKRKEFLNEHKNLSYTVYTKLFGKSETDGGSSIGFFGTTLTPHKGVFYLSESINKVYQYDIANQTEKLEASLVLGDSSRVTENSTIFINLYENRPFRVESGMVTTRIISPIANDAFGFYDYDYLGTFEESGESVHKIEIIPKMKGASTFEGEIYIIDGSWRVLKSHLYIKTMLGRSQINTQYIRDENAGSYFPFSSTFIITRESEKTEIYSYNIYYDYKLEAEALDRNKLLNQHISKEGTFKNSEWWEKTRPIELTKDERQAYERIKVTKKDIFKFEQEKNDTLLHDLKGEKRDTPFQVYQKAMNSKKVELKENLSLDLSFFTFNTVEGGVLKPHLIYTNAFNKKNRYTADAELRYGFASNSFYYSGGFTYELSPKNISEISIHGGSTVEQISGNTSISNFWNAYYSLLSKENFLKLYQKDFVGVRWKREISNGLDVSIGGSLNRRYPLQNSSSYTWYDEEEETREYTPNQAFIQGEYRDFSSTDLLESNLLLSYQHKRKFNLINGRKVALSSKFPVLKVGIDVGLQNVEYSRIWMNISDNIHLKSLGVSTISLSYGQYLTSANLTPIDLFHFMGNRILVNQNQMQYGLTYQLMDYYNYSTSEYFAGANFEHDFDGVILGRVPLLKKIGLKSYIMANYLQTAVSPSYTEVGVGLTSSIVPIRFSYFRSFENRNFVRQGIIMYANF